MSANRPFDIVIVGGGMAGLLLARLLECRAAAEISCKPSIALIEPQPPLARTSNAELDLRVVALSPVSLALLDRTGALAMLPTATCHPYESMRVWQDGGGPLGSHAIHFSAAESGVKSLGCIVENHAIRSALWQQVVQSEATELIDKPVTSLRQSDDEFVLDCEGIQVRTRLLVGADGARSRVRRLLQVPSRERAYRQNALVTHLSTEHAHADTAWQKFLPDGPVALLPLADGRSSLVWSHPEKHSEELLGMADGEFAGHLQSQLDNVLGDMCVTARRVTFPLMRGHAQVYTGQRFALIGDAAHRVHPLAGQGANLGFQDAAVLAEEIVRHMRRRWADPGDAVMLRRYERRRKGDNLLTLGTMDVLNSIFASPLAGLAGTGLGLVNRAGPLKTLLAGQAMGSGSVQRD